ncbi:acetyl-CoA acetyltransferase [[Candida] jaroonii]|uniref:Acetyl-CoA acetyltransferase n=1 Tax=[Candida] jaroonii TaxID=467808 RepID=A0ACA9Y5C4_9ASCO|nr:acetyl-CoA acetyltransferase [[Candida] jaroonii]
MVYIVSSARTPMGSFLGSLSPLGYVDLGSHAVKAALKRSGILADDVDEIIFGCALGANIGQDPARQVGLAAGLPDTVVSTTINKVCASGMKAIILGYQSIITGSAEVVVVGGAESMSNVPYYVTRNGYKYGKAVLTDGLRLDGLTDAYDGFLMGVAGDKLGADMGYTREEIDDYAVNSYQKAFQAYDNDKFGEIEPIVLRTKQGTTVISRDEDLVKYNEEKLRAAKPAFREDGTVTAPNAPSLNDGGAALILVSEDKLKELNLVPLAKIVSYGEAATTPIDFTIAPSMAVPIALERAQMKISDVDYFEFNEAFSTVGLANTQKLAIDSAKVNVYGGAVAMGHPLGCSGARIVVTLLSVLKQEGGKVGVAAICNGGGGASSVVVERVGSS